MGKLKPFTLLYAEDDDLIAKGYTNYFKQVFKTVYRAKDGKEAYEIYKEHKPDILLLDIKMPYINGLELTEMIREQDETVKIIILTAHKDEAKLFQAIPLKLINYMTKPVKKRDLEKILYKTISKLEESKNNTIVFSQSVTWDTVNAILENDGVEIHLTKNEIILLQILSTRPLACHSLDNLLEAFWQHQSQDLSLDSIRSIIKRLKLKLPKDSIKNHYSIGYKLCIQ